MIKVCLFFLFFWVGCISNTCTENRTYVQIQKVFDLENISIAKSREVEFKKMLMSRICSHIDGNHRILFIEEIRHFGEERSGLIYLYEKKEILYFFKKASGNIVVGPGYNNYVSLKKVLNIIVNDFYNQGNKLKVFFENKILNDSPLLQLFYFDTNFENQANYFFEFFYLPFDIDKFTGY